MAKSPRKQFGSHDEVAYNPAEKATQGEVNFREVDQVKRQKILSAYFTESEAASFVRSIDGSCDVGYDRNMRRIDQIFGYCLTAFKGDMRLIQKNR